MKPSGGHWQKTTSASVLGVDTNVLLRFLVEDDVKQNQQAAQLLGNAESQPVYVSRIVVVECFWVLTKVKKYPARQVFAMFEKLLFSNAFILEEATQVAQALSDAEDAGCDLADAIIALVNERAGCSTTATFDIDAQNLPGMTAVKELLT